MTVNKYTTEFYQLLVCNDIQETQDQLVSRYYGGLCLQILDMVNLFYLVTVSYTHQRALQIEKTMTRKVGMDFWQATTLVQWEKWGTVIVALDGSSGQRLATAKACHD